MKQNKIAITMGEPGGIGPEVIVKALYNAEIRRSFSPIVIGNTEVMQEAVQLTGLPFKVSAISDISDSSPADRLIEVLEVRSRLSRTKQAPSKSAGIAIVKYIKKAVDLTLNNQVSAIVTAPISKESLKIGRAHV